MRYVTFYWDVFSGVRDKVLHPDMPTALKYFRRHHKDYFQLNVPFNPPKLPASYGYGHRRYFGMSIRQYNKYWKSKEAARD